GLSKNAAKIEELNERLMKLTVMIKIGPSSIRGEDWKTKTVSIVEDFSKETTNLKHDFIHGAIFY
ncbi:hypothetical protein CCACVL1_25791, partial [Corchorus capsularis]